MFEKRTPDAGDLACGADGTGGLATVKPAAAKQEVKHNLATWPLYA